MTRLPAFLLVLALTACGRDSGDTVQGYVDAQTYLIAAQATARIISVPVTEGDTVAQGALLAKLDDRDAAAAHAQAAARLAETEADAMQARATFTNAEREFKRIEALRTRKVASESDLDAARQTFDVAKAGLDAVDSRRAAARAALAEADWQLGERTLTAPAAGHIEQVYFRPGEIATPGRPLVSLLPPGEVKIVFFVPQGLLSTVPLNTIVSVSCDGCGASIPARVSFISSQAEFTPPVIYSVGARDKLVFKLEARPTERVDALRIGQPVDVRLPEGKGTKG